MKQTLNGQHFLRTIGSNYFPIHDLHASLTRFRRKRIVTSKNFTFTSPFEPLRSEKDRT